VIEVCGNWYFDPFLEKLGFNVLSAAPMESSAINFNHDTASVSFASVSSGGMQVLYSPRQLLHQEHCIIYMVVPLG